MRKIKKRLSFLFIFALILTNMNIVINAADNISVYYNDKKIDFDVQPIVVDDRTLVPMRKLFEVLGATVQYDSETNTAVGYTKGIRVEIPIGESYILHNYVHESLDVPSQEIDGRVLIPLRAVAEAFCMSVQYDEASQKVTLSPLNILGEYDLSERYYYYGKLIAQKPSGYGAVYNKETGSCERMEFFKSNGDTSKGIDGCYDLNVLVDLSSGSFEDGTACGYIEWYEGTFTYEGWIENNIFNGKGSYYEGSYSYKGDFVNGLYDGYGVQNWSNDGHHFEGYFKNGLRNGSGTYIADGDFKYIGEWKDGDRSGYGIEYDYNKKRLSNGAWKQYEGVWENDYPNGYGTAIYSDGTKESGMWENGEFKG